MTTLLPILLRYIWFNFLSRNDIIKSIALLYALVHEREIEIVERVSPGRNTDLLASMEATGCLMRHGKSKQPYAMFWWITESFTKLNEITDSFRPSTKNWNPNRIVARTVGCAIRSQLDFGRNRCTHRRATHTNVLWWWRIYLWFALEWSQTWQE